MTKAALPKPPVKSIKLEADRIDFDSFIFPGETSFASATFSGYARFKSPTFSGNAWFKSATFSGDASFASATFSGYASFESATFSGRALFASATFTGDAWFESATFTGGAQFESATFSSYAWFESATFSGDARFDSATFTGNAWFKSATFSSFAWFDTGDAWFESATFSGGAQFESATFSGDARFESATFSGDAWFERATFTGNAWFESATFTGNALFEHATFTGYAWFESATFTGGALFERARFRREADFSGIDSKRAFSLIGARFRWRVPDFLSAKFAEPVLLDNVQLATGVAPGGLLRSVLGAAVLWMVGDLDAALSAKYRALKRLAIQSDDHRNEQIFFRGELRSRRYHEDKPWHAGFWFGILYELACDFGHSISRPVLWLIAIGLLSSWFYLGQGVAPDVSPRAHIEAALLSHLPDRVQTLIPALRPAALPPLACKDGSAGDPVAAASLLAAKKSSVFASFNSAEKSTQIYACLYGFDERTRTAVVPDAVVLWGIWQTVASAALLFLFLLALRNQFKIK